MSLFPFLAVLICTMGALILLLVIIAHQARLQAAQPASASHAEQSRELNEAREDAQWLSEELTKSREASETELADARIRLGRIESHMRDLKEHIKQLEATYAAMQQDGEQQGQEGRDVVAEIKRFEQQIGETERQLAEARERITERKASFAVVPYRGNHATFRQPIYIECRADSVVLQPEGIVLNEADLTGPLGPGNPLAAALRAKRGYLANQAAGKANEPYPLLLVRPDGILAYYAARSAMSSWASGFGYELIESNWKLAYQPADQHLAATMSEAIEKARVEQQLVAAAAPSVYRRGSNDRPRYRVSPTRGGVIPARGAATRRRASAARGSTGNFGGLSQGSRSLSGGTHDGAGPENRALANSANASPRNAGPGTQGPVLVGPGRQAAGSGTAAAENSSHHDRPFGRPPEEEQASTDRGMASRPLGPGEWQPPEKRSPQKESLADLRGRDWGLRDASISSMAVTRPIRVDCLADRLVLVSSSGPYANREIPLGPETRDSIDLLVSAVWDHMDSWGIAGKNMYWRPILRLRVAPDAENRYTDLEGLLSGSGLTVQRVQTGRSGTRSAGVDATKR